uniref:Dimer_Tnp_hAT domain-containing protein n=1 Tax=Caenorhabditis japonica TaxID=281687 RepID=A0A8R1DTB3_CAEJA
MPSPVWTLFTLKDNVVRNARCKLCRDWVTFKSNTSSLIRHALVKHNLSLENLRTMKENAKLSAFSEAPVALNNEALRTQQAVMFVSCGLSHSMAENHEYRKYCKMLNEDYVPISADTMRRDIFKLDADYRKNLKKEFAGKTNMVLLTDGWRSANEAFELYCLIAVYVDGKGEGHQRVVGVVDVADSSADNLIIAFSAELAKSGITLGQFSFFVAGCGGSNLVSLAEKLNYSRLNCVCHQLHLLMNRVTEIRALAEVLRKAKRISGTIAKSTKIKTEMRRIASQNGNKSSLPQNYSSTRWNGSRDLLNAIKSHIRTIASLDDFSGDHFTAKEMRILEIFLELSLPLQKCILQFDHENSTSSEALPHLLYAKCQIEEAAERIEKDPENSSVETELQSIKSMMSENIQNLISDLQSNKLLHLTLLADPRYAYSKVLPDEVWKESEQQFLNRFPRTLSTPKSESEDNSQSVQRKNRTIDEFLYKPASVSPHSTVRQHADVELEKYKSDVCKSRITSASDPNDYWNSKKTAFPILHSTALVLLSIPSSSCSTERIFSRAGRLIANRYRNRLNAESCSALLMTQASLGFERYRGDDDDDYYETSDEIDEGDEDSQTP